MTKYVFEVECKIREWSGSYRTSQTIHVVAGKLADVEGKTKRYWDKRQAGEWHLDHIIGVRRLGEVIR